MARRSRNSEIELNFDGLTDATTNLVGALILLVLLLVGVTRQYVESAVQAVAPPPPPPVIEEPLEGPKTLDELRRQAATLRAAIVQTDEEITKLEQKMPELRARAEMLVSGNRNVP